MCTEKIRHPAGDFPPPRRKSPPVIGSASRGGQQSQGSVLVVGNGNTVISQNSLQQLNAFQAELEFVPHGVEDLQDSRSASRKIIRSISSSHGESEG